jgi:hypothetical protein
VEVALLFVIGIAATAAAMRRMRTDPLRRMLLTPPSSAVTATDGAQVVMRGTVALAEPGADLASPISRRQCVYWLVTFDELGIGGDYLELGRMEQGRTFLVATPEGAARIVPTHAQVHVPGTVSLYAAHELVAGTEADSAIKLARTCCKKPNYPYTSSLRVTEYAVVPGMHVILRGHCTREPDPGAPADVTGYRTELPSRPVLSGTRDAPLLVCDYSDYRRIAETGQ